MEKMTTFKLCCTSAPLSTSFEVILPILKIDTIVEMRQIAGARLEKYPFKIIAYIHELKNVIKYLSTQPCVCTNTAQAAF
jgi:hypothetical protein